MTDNDYRANVLDRLGAVEASIAALTARIAAVEVKGAVDEVHRQNVEKRLTSIENGISRLFWLLGGALAVAVVTFVVNGGLAQ